MVGLKVSDTGLRKFLACTLCSCIHFGTHTCVFTLRVCVRVQPVFLSLELYKSAMIDLVKVESHLCIGRLLHTDDGT